MNDNFGSNFSGLTNDGQQFSFPKSSIPTKFNRLLAKKLAFTINLEPGDYVARVFGKNGSAGIGRVGVNIILD